MCRRDHVDDSVVTGITELNLREPQFIQQGLPHRTLDVVGDVHRPSVGDDEHGMRGCLSQLQEGILHLDLILHHGLLYIVEVLAVGGSKVYRSIAEERRRLGERIDEVAEIAEVLDDLRQRSRLASAGASSQGDTSNILIHMIL